MRTGRCCVVLTALLVLAVGCGSDASDSGLESSGSSEDTSAASVPNDAAPQPTPIVVGRSIVEQFGPADGVAATLYALDAGYSAGQIVGAASERTLRADGTVVDTDPDGTDHGLIAAPIQGLRGSSAGREVRPDEVQAEIDGKLATLATINLLGAPLGLDGEFGYSDVFPPEPTLDPVTAEAAEATIGVILALVDVGYSFEQVVNGFVFGETDMAVALDRSDETEKGLLVDGFAACLVLRDTNGDAIVPTSPGTNRLVGSQTCGKAIRAGTISFDGLDALLADTADDELVEEEPAPPPAEDPGGSFEPSLSVGGTEVAFLSCPDPNFPDVCEYSFSVTLDYVTPTVPATVRCNIGFMSDTETVVNDQVGTVTLTGTFSVLWGRDVAFENPEEPTASCTLIPPGLSVEAVGDAAEPPG